MFFIKRNERRLGVEKSWPYFLLFLKPNSCSLGQKFISMDPRVSHSPGDPIPSYLHQDYSEGVIDVGVLLL